MKLYLVRHGESEANRRDIHNGPDERLSSRGQREAEMLASRLTAIPFDVAYVSPLRRARDTAERIIAAHAKLTVHFDDRLRECDNGDLAGTPHGSRLAAARAQGIAPASFRPNGGESTTQMIERVRHFWRELSDGRAPTTVLIVSHKGPITVLIGELSATRHEQGVSAVRTGSLTIADTEARPAIVLVDDTQHIEGL